MISTKVIDQAQHILIQEKQELVNRLQLREGANKPTGELSNYDNHPGDQGTALYDQEKELALHGHAKHKVEEINDALKKIESDTYAICEICGNDIEEERILAVPTTSRCQTHAEGRLTNERPVEEDIMEPDIISSEVKAEAKESTAFDGKDSWQAVEAYGSSETPSDFYKKKGDYDDMYIDSDELAGSSEEIEEVATTDINGKNQPSRRKAEKEDND
ncbi:TraR/DksA C4-type zinc finger protein [Radiobacillus sp. PE A8.2]|uniref:TraR/DksA C4-type zinc finger protein n=1 Tax=Radiobacillus sp. PE A8.2 TaxID=3380349 RepID=UPI00388CFDC7